MKSLVIAEIKENGLAKDTSRLISAASQLGEVTVLIAVDQAMVAAADDAAYIEGVKEVIVAQAAHYKGQLAEELTALVTTLAGPYDYIVATSNTFGKNILPRIAGLLNRPAVSEVIQIKGDNCFVHPIYAGNILETVQILAQHAILMIRSNQFKVAQTNKQTAPIRVLEKCPAPLTLSHLLQRTSSTCFDRPSLEEAKIVVAGGRGLGSKEAFDRLIIPLADVLHAAVGASRAAVDAQFISNDHQVGQTGKIVAPELYIAVGISGAIQHLAGMQDSTITVAINKDPQAPIFQFADYGLVGDLFEVVPQLIEHLKT